MTIFNHHDLKQKNCAMMGLQGTAGKRKLDVSTAAPSLTRGEEASAVPAKAGRWSDSASIVTSSSDSSTQLCGGAPLTVPSAPPPTSDDCIARLRAVAVPGETAHWQHQTSSALATTLLASDDLDDDELDDYDDFSDDDKCPGAPEIGYPTTPPQGYQPAARYPDASYHQRQQGYYPPEDAYQQYNSRLPPRAPPHWTGQSNYYAQSQQTIRRDENGKSYLELGSAPPPPPRHPIRCCDGRTRWCSSPCYRQRRLAILNLSMCKLARYRQCSDPSLRRSVLICNTLRLIEREMEAEGNQQIAALQAQAQHQQSLEVHGYATSAFSDYSNANRLTPVVESSYEQNLRDLSLASGRATPFPTQSADTDSGLGDEDTSRSINWGSVLSLTSQTDLDPLNNNELYPLEPAADSDLTMNSASDQTGANVGLEQQLIDEFSPTWNKTVPSVSSTCSVDEMSRTEQSVNYGSRFPGEGEWDSFMQVLVGGS